jgi:N-acetylglucosaminyldiphosphoundecaprenol N-acetyl-beta-D-mannosaminyltransferase
MEKVEILGCPCLVTMDEREMEEYILSLVARKLGGYSVAINAEKVMMFSKQQEVKDLIKSSILPIIDSEGARWGIKRLYGIRYEKIDLPKLILTIANENKLRFFLLGSKEENNRKALDEIRKRYPNINIVGSNHGYFKDEKIMVQKLADSKAQIVLLGLGSPKQELFAHKYFNELPETIFVGGGGAINVLAGTRRRPPSHIRDNGRIPVEWLHVLITDPSMNRFKRELVLPVYFCKIFFAKIKNIILRRDMRAISAELN